MGERVLGFSRLDLDVNLYKKSDYFGTKDWKSWMTTKNYDAALRKSAGWFPMHGLTFIGLVSLNDPPRPGVDLAVQKCKAAGIKVIMVTGDQKNTAAAIAAKVSIITDKETEYNWLVDKCGMTPEKAMEECKSIVVHGDELAAVNFKEEGLDDAEIEKGRKIMDWIRKPEVVFARTTPSQKLLIVNACQNLGEVVAVTGDGVNDSPAIKKADIGVAMGCGSEVAQNAGDMILLDDNFCSIVNGVEEGRLIFDNLKKSIAYTLSSNIPEISPFLFFIIFQVPLPLSTVLILCIDLGTDMVPAISFAYENPELDIMERYPRNSKRDHLVNAKLISFAYLQIGIVQASAGFFTYFYILHDYGIRPSTTFALALEDGYIPAPTDVYNPAALNYGNSNYLNESAKTQINWNGNQHNGVDVRLFYVNRTPDSWSRCRWNEGEGLDFYKNSIVSGAQICYTTEGLRFAQAGYLVSIVCVQWADLMICKTRALSISQQGMVNYYSNAGLVFETVLVAILLYAPFFNEALGTRQIAFPHFAIPSFSFFAVIMSYDELRKIYLRGGMSKSRRGRAVIHGWVARNTYY
jgi:sodium/potassium-transporting ATPase subunit alpha